MMDEKTFEQRMGVREKITDLISEIDQEIIPEQEKIDAINYAIKMLNDLKKEIKQGRS